MQVERFTSNSKCLRVCSGLTADVHTEVCVHCFKCKHFGGLGAFDHKAGDHAAAAEAEVFLPFPVSVPSPAFQSLLSEASPGSSLCFLRHIRDEVSIQARVIMMTGVRG